MMGEGYAAKTPSPIRNRGHTIAPSPARGEGTKGESAEDGLSAAKRVHDRASGTSCKARVVAFPCFRPVPSCYRRPNRATHATPLARISRLHPAAYGQRRGGQVVARPPFFPPGFSGNTRETQGLR